MAVTFTIGPDDYPELCALVDLAAVSAGVTGTDAVTEPTTLARSKRRSWPELR